MRNTIQRAVDKIINNHPIPEKREKKRKKEKSCQARMLYPGKVCFKNDDELKTLTKAKTDTSLLAEPSSKKF